MVAKLLDHAEKSKTISYDEISDWLPEEMVKSEVMNDIIALLESSGVVITEDSKAVPVRDDEASTDVKVDGEDDADEETGVLLDDDEVELDSGIGVGSALTKGDGEAGEPPEVSSDSIVASENSDDSDDS
ncbi:MAG: hypothetical protein KAJ98_00900, partial [Spirochaetaceae bacterium]|nr:hypothetical protein [Spirochaetaceae bacterium]